MPTRKSKRKWKPRRRGEPGTPQTVARSYTLPVSVFVAIRNLAAEYGSQGRAIQVGSEVLSRLEEPLPVKPASPASQIRRTYKLAPRTVRLINELKEAAYDNSGQVLDACIKALSLKNLRPRKKPPLRDSK